MDTSDKMSKEWEKGYHDGVTNSSGIMDYSLGAVPSSAYNEGWRKGQKDRQNDI